MAVHNHGPEESECGEAVVDGELRGHCLRKEKPMSFLEQVVEASCFNWERNVKDFYLGKFRIGWGLDWHNAFKLTLSHTEDGVYIGEVDSKTIPVPVIAQVIDLLVKNYREA